MSKKGKMLILLLRNMPPPQKSNCTLLKKLTMLYFPKFLVHKTLTATSSMIFNNQFFTHRIQYLFFIVFKSLLLFKSLIVTTVEVNKFHTLINRNKEKNTAMMLNVIASKLNMIASNYQVLLTFSGGINSHVNKL